MDSSTSAYRDGWFAHKNDCRTESNPYSETLQFSSHSEWLSGWCARFAAVKHGKDMSLDEFYP
jgi:allantoicase